jgi:hypothetical protein
MARSQKKSASRSGRKPVKITRRFLDALTSAKEDAYYRVLDALGISRREHISPTKAAKRSGTTLRTMRKYASSALEERSGRVYIKPSDRLPRRPHGQLTHSDADRRVQ